MKKYIIIIIICFALIGGIVYYVITNNTQEDTNATEYLAQADDYYNDKQYSKALEQYKLAINTDPSNIESYLKAAEIYFLKSKIDDAIELLLNGENTVTNPDMLHYKLGQLFLEKDDKQVALEYFEQANKENPNNWENSIELVKLYSYYPDKIEQSIKTLEKIETEDNEGYRWTNYYFALLSYSETDKALEYLNDSTNISDSEVKDRINNLIEILNKTKSDPEDIVQNNTLIAYEMIRSELYPYAITLLGSVISENDEYYAAYMYLGICYLNMNDLDKAAENLTTATNTDSDQIQPWIFLAQVYTKQSNQKLAIDTFEEALNINREDETVRYDYAKTLEIFGLYMQAKTQYNELIELNTSNQVQYKIDLSLIHIDYLEEYEEGLNLIKEVVENWNSSLSVNSNLKAEALDVLGWAYENNDEKDNALKYLKQSLEINPYNASAYYHLGYVYSEIDNYVEANSNFERAIDLDLEGDISSKASIELEYLTNENTD